MNDLKQQIKNLAPQTTALEPTEEQRDMLLNTVQKYSNQFINNLPAAKSYSSKKAKKEAFAVGKGTKSLQEVLEIYSKEVASKGIRAASGGHLGYIPGGGIYTSALADYLADITNEYAGISFASPGAVAMELELLNWLKKVFGFPGSAVGNLTSGGSIANMIALTAARDRHKIKGTKIEKSVVYVSPHVHHCNTKALRIIGLEDVVIRHLPLDARSRIVAAELAAKVSADKNAGLNPFLVIGSAGTTDTGAVDPLKELARIAGEHGLWFHVDAAYGGFFILTEEKKQLFEGIEMADSLAVDPHKGLFLPFGLGAVLVKDKEAVFHSHHHSANYMQDAQEDPLNIDPADVSPELTKHFRALRLWLPLQLYGIEPFAATLQEKLLLTQYFRERMQQLGYGLGPEPDLSVTYFWWPWAEQIAVPPEGNAASEDENDFNRHLLKEIHQDGSVFLSSTKIDDRFVIRLAVVSFRTKLDTIERAIEVVEGARERATNRFYENDSC